jgi:two-component system, LytTR family, response regulator LytT
MKLLIVEDEAPALSRIIKMLKELDIDIEIAATADSILAACTIFENHSDFDLALMDIELADGQSFEIFKRVNVYCPVIFTTAYDEFALKAFKVNSIDYLLKPIDKRELKSAIEKFESTRLSNPSNVLQQKLSSLIQQIKPEQTSFKNRFLIKAGTKLISVSTQDIAYFHAADKCIYLYTNKQDKYIMDQSLDELIRLLDSTQFFHLNRQFIININNIKSVNSYFNGKLKVEINPPVNEDILVSRDRASEFKKWLDT